MSFYITIKTFYCSTEKQFFFINFYIHLILQLYYVLRQSLMILHYYVIFQHMFLRDKQLILSTQYIICLRLMYIYIYIIFRSFVYYYIHIVLMYLRFINTCQFCVCEFQNNF